MILLTDGLNTANRFTTVPSQIDARTAAVCDNIKKANIRLFTVRVIEGNLSLLQGCATAPNMFYDVQVASELQGRLHLDRREPLRRAALEVAVAPCCGVSSRNCRGGVAPMFAIAAIPLIGAIGAAIDYSRAATVRTQLLAAADAASLASVRKSSAALAAAANMSGDGPIPAGAAEATKLFNARADRPERLHAWQRHRHGHQDRHQHRLDGQLHGAGADELHGPVRHHVTLRSAAPPRRRTACRSSSTSICCSTTRPRWASARPRPTSPRW